MEPIDPQTRRHLSEEIRRSDRELFDPGWLHHRSEGRTGPVPQGAGPSASQAREDRVPRLIEALLGGN
jgi:hypothetical protein